MTLVIMDFISIIFGNDRIDNDFHLLKKKGRSFMVYRSGPSKL